jgi:hypothetical protein
MPLKLNIGASKKIADHSYGSRGASINLEIELDASLVTEPTKLQEKVRYLFALARQAVAEELNGVMNGHGPTSDNGNGQSKAPAPAHGNGAPRNGGQRQATVSQVKAIHAIARNQRIDVAKFLNERLRIADPSKLTIKQASTAIDELKGNDGDGRAA